MTRPGAWENPLCPIDINTMHNEPGFKLSVSQQIEQPVLSPDAADDEMGQSYQHNMSIQQQQVYHNDSEIVDQGRMYDEERPLNSKKRNS